MSQSNSRIEKIQQAWMDEYNRWFSPLIHSAVNKLISARREGDFNGEQAAFFQLERLDAERDSAREYIASPDFIERIELALKVSRKRNAGRPKRNAGRPSALHSIGDPNAGELAASVREWITAHAKEMAAASRNGGCFYKWKKLIDADRTVRNKNPDATIEDVLNYYHKHYPNNPRADKKALSNARYYRKTCDKKLAKEAAKLREDAKME